MDPVVSVGLLQAAGGVPAGAGLQRAAPGATEQGEGGGAAGVHRPGRDQEPLQPGLAAESLGGQPAPLHGSGQLRGAGSAAAALQGAAEALQVLLAAA